MKESYYLDGRCTKRAFLRRKRKDGKALLKALSAFRHGCAYLPPSADRNGGLLMAQLEAWIKGPCRAAWKRA